MKPLNLLEFAQQLRLEGNEFADEILMLVNIETEVAEPYSDLCFDIELVAPNGMPVEKAVEWLGDRSQELDEIRECFSEEAMAETSIPELIKELQDERDTIETVMREHGGWTEGDLQDALFALIDRANKAAPKLEYDL